jgi:1,4-dihydroxy-2-naphthoate octaprenyltransferase
MPRWFALPWFGGMTLLGSIMAGGSLSERKTWAAFLATTFLMAGCHAQNTLWDWHADLDKGNDRSVEKNYSGGCGVIASGRLSLDDVIANALVFTVLALIMAFALVVRTGWPIAVPVFLGILVPYFYTRGKFSWYHETVLAGSVALSAVVGMLAIDPAAAWWKGALVSVPPAVTLSYMGLAVDEFPDARANLAKGVKSLAYRVYQNFDLSLYIVAWVSMLYLFQVFLIAVGLLKPLTAMTFVLVPFLIARLVALHPWSKELRSKDDCEDNLQKFNKEAKWVVLIGMFYPVLTLLGQII